MADESKTIILPDNQNGNGWNAGIPLALALNPGWNNNYPYNNNGFFGGSGFGAGILGGLLGGLIWGGIGNGGFGFGGWGGNGNAAASLGAQATANNNAETILRAIDGTDSDVRLLATTLNTDVNTVKTNLATIQNGLTQISGQTGMSAQQIINAIQQGDASLASQSIIEQVEAHKKVIASCDKLLLDLNPQLKKDQEHAQEIARLKDQLAGMSEQIAAITGMLSKSLGKTKKEE